MNRRRLLRAGAWALAPVAGCLERSDRSDTEFDVGMGSNFFRPETLRVSPGETVRWRNTGARAHTVTAYEAAIPDDAAFFASGGFDTEQSARDAFFESNEGNGALYSGESFSHRFDIAGRYEYFCIPHEQQGMVGTVVVEE